MTQETKKGPLDALGRRPVSGKVTQATRKRNTGAILETLKRGTEDHQAEEVTLEINADTQMKRKPVTGEKEKETGDGIQERDMGVGNPEKETEVGTPEKETGTGIQEREMGIGNPERERGVGTPEKETGVGIPGKATGTGIQEKETGAGTVEKETRVQIPETKKGLGAPVKETGTQDTEGWSQEIVNGIKKTAHLRLKIGIKNGETSTGNMGIWNNTAIL